MEGRFIYDCFVLNEKADAIYYHGAQAVLKPLNVMTAAMGEGQTGVLVEPSSPESGNKWQYVLAADGAALNEPVYGETYSGGTDLAGNGAVVSVGSETAIGVVEMDAAGKAVAWGSAQVNAG